MFVVFAAGARSVKKMYHFVRAILIWKKNDSTWQFPVKKSNLSSDHAETKTHYLWYGQVLTIDVIGLVT